MLAPRQRPILAKTVPPASTLQHWAPTLPKSFAKTVPPASTLQPWAPTLLTRAKTAASVQFRKQEAMNSATAGATWATLAPTETARNARGVGTRARPVTARAWLVLPGSILRWGRPSVANSAPAATSGPSVFYVPCVCLHRLSFSLKASKSGTPARCCVPCLTCPASKTSDSARCAEAPKLHTCQH